MSKYGQFAKNELDWAKIRGYPWWPGIVLKLKKIIDFSFFTII